MTRRADEGSFDGRGCQAEARLAAVPAAGAATDREEAEAAVRTLIAWAGDDPDREGLLDTPRRVVKAYEELFAGYREDPAKPLERVFHDVDGYKDIVLVRDIRVRFALRAPYRAVHRQGAYRLLPAPRGRRPVEARAHRRHVRPPAADPGGDVGADRRGDRAALNTARRRGDDRGRAHLHVDARRGKHGASTVTTQFTGVFRDDPNEQTRFLTLAARRAAEPWRGDARTARRAWRSRRTSPPTGSSPA